MNIMDYVKIHNWLIVIRQESNLGIVNDTYSQEELKKMKEHTGRL